MSNYKSFKQSPQEFVQDLENLQEQTRDTIIDLLQMALIEETSGPRLSDYNDDLMASLQDENARYHEEILNLLGYDYDDCF